jgi:antitoxin VapB
MSVCYTFTPWIVYHDEIMALNIKNTEVERLATELARQTGESKTEVIRRALQERQRRLKGASINDRRARVLRFLEKKVWPTLPKGQRGRRLSRAEEDEILGYGPGGV